MPGEQRIAKRMMRKPTTPMCARLLSDILGLGPAPRGVKARKGTVVNRRNLPPRLTIVRYARNANLCVCQSTVKQNLSSGTHKKFVKPNSQIIQSAVFWAPETVRLAEKPLF